MAFLLPQVQRTLHFTAKVQLMRNRFSGFGHSSESRGGKGTPPRTWMGTSALQGLFLPLSGATELSPQQRKRVVESWGWGQNQSPHRCLKGALERGASERWSFQSCSVLFFLSLETKLGQHLMITTIASLFWGLPRCQVAQWEGNRR